MYTCARSSNYVRYHYFITQTFTFSHTCSYTYVANTFIHAYVHTTSTLEIAGSNAIQGSSVFLNAMSLQCADLLMSSRVRAPSLPR